MPGSAEQKAKIYYESCLDRNDTVELRGTKPMQDLIESVSSLTSIEICAPFIHLSSIVVCLILTWLKGFLLVARSQQDARVFCLFVGQLRTTRAATRPS